MKQEAILTFISTTAILTIGHFYLLSKCKQKHKERIKKLEIALLNQEDYIIDKESELERLNKILEEVLILFNLKDSDEINKRIAIIREKIKAFKQHGKEPSRK